MPLTDTQVRNARPQAKPYRIADGANLYLLVQPEGGKLWQWRYRFGGKSKTLSLGSYHQGHPKHVGIKEARKAADKARDLLATGTDPMAARREVKARQRVVAGETFEEVARAWHTLKAPSWSTQHAADVLHSLTKDVFPVLGDVNVRDVTALMVIDCVRAIADRGSVDIAHRVKQRIAGVLGYALQLRLVERNEAAGLRDVLPAVVKGHRPALPVARLPEFFTRLSQYRGDPSTLYALRLAVLTALRPGEVRHARWDEFDLDAALWTIPGQRMKGVKARKARTDHLVPLSRQAVALLRELHALHGRYPILFPGVKEDADGNPRPIGENTMGVALQRMGYAGIATAHGFRALFSTVANEHGFNPDWVERQLAHVPANEIRAAYNRAAYLDDRRATLQWFADYVDAVVAGRDAPLPPHKAPAASSNDATGTATVVPLPRRAG